MIDLTIGRSGQPKFCAQYLNLKLHHVHHPQHFSNSTSTFPFLDSAYQDACYRCTLPPGAQRRPENSLSSRKCPIRSLLLRRWLVVLGKNEEQCEPHAQDDRRWTGHRQRYTSFLSKLYSLALLSALSPNLWTDIPHTPCHHVIDDA